MVLHEKLMAAEGRGLAPAIPWAFRVADLADAGGLLPALRLPMANLYAFLVS